jgi:hypothetical protein
MRALKEQLLPEKTWSLPAGWTWTITRVIHCMPEEQTDGWRVTLFGSGTPVIEVIHRSQEHACAVALSAAAEIYPSTFKGYAS